MGDPIASWELHVYRPQQDGKTWEDLGDALANPIPVQAQDRLKLKATFHEPVFPAVLAINPDGTVQLLKAFKDGEPGRRFQALSVPPDPGKYVRLTDPGPTAFVLLVSRDPLSDPSARATGAVETAACDAAELTCTFDGHHVLPVLKRRVAEESVAP